LKNVQLKSSVLLCIFFFVVKKFNAKDVHKKSFLFTVRSVCHVSGPQLGKETISRLKAADDARPGRPVEIATKGTVQRVEELIRADRMITINSVVTA
jgi:hypothetical protein